VLIFRIFEKQRGELHEFPHFCKIEGGDVSISALLETLEDMR
jgi:hypothetical protein